MRSIAVALRAVGSFLLGAMLVAGARAQCRDWAEGFGVAGAFRSVKAAVVFDGGQGSGPRLYIGGDFASVGNTTAARVARWNGSAFEALGSGLDGPALCFAVHDDGSGPALFVGGAFKTAGGQPARSIARWDGASWSPVGPGIDGMVEALAVFDDGSGPRLVAGGSAVTPGGSVGTMLRSWDGAAWSEVGGGVGGPGSGSVSALRVHDDGGGEALFVGGRFTQAGGQPVSNVARWDGQAWSTLGTGTDGGVRALCEASLGGQRVLVAGGDFTQAGGQPAGHVARWDGQAWQPLGPGLNGDVRALRVHDDGSGPVLVAGGSFFTVGGAGVNGVARWDGSSWSPLGAGLGWVYALEVFDLGGTGGPALIACGEFSGSGRVAAAGIASWDGAGWSPLVAGNGVTGSVEAFEIYDDGGGPALYAAGAFGAAGAAFAWPPGLARWTGTGWVAVPPPAWMCSYPTALAVFDPGTGPGLYVASDDCLAMWDGSAWDPTQQVGLYTPGNSPGVRALLVHDDGAGPALYVGGGFSSTTCTTPWLGTLVRWDGTACTWMACPLDTVLALATFDVGSGPALIAAGADAWTGAGRVALWDGASWAFLGGIQPGPLHALAVFDDGSGPALHAGGRDGLLRWDGTGWVSLGGGDIRALVVHDDGTGAPPGLYAAGSTVERWGGSTWTPLGAGVELDPSPASSTFDPTARALCSFDDGSGPRLWVGGWIQAAGGRPSVGIARWGEACGCTGTPYCTAKTNSAGCVPSMGSSGITNLTASQPFTLFATQVLNNKYGLLFYGTSGADSKPFLGGTLCVRSPIRRTPVQWSGGNPPPDDCSGMFSMDFKAYALSGVDPALVAGASVFAQYWYRDPGDTYGSSTTDAVAFTLCP